MVVKVGINGFGRVGRVVFRTCLQHPDLQIAAINDPAVEVEYICYLIKFDSTHGKLTGDITHNESEVKINDDVIKVLHHKVPSSIPWQTAGVQYVVEASGMFTCLDKASGHLASDGVRRVIVTAPSIDVPMIILGVNDNKLFAEHKVMSCGSSTLYCLAPIVKVLEDSFGVQDGFITSIHAMTPSLKPLDGLCLRGKHWRDHRSIHQNIIPATTGACKALGKIIPQVKDKMTGLAFRVPIVNVSVLDLTIRLKKETTVEEIAQKVEKAGTSYLQNIIKISYEETVSSDFIGDKCSCILDFNSSLQLKPDFFKLVCWYENEYSYACRVIDSIMFTEKQLEHLDLKSKMTYVRPRPSKKQDMIQQTDFFLKVTSKIKYDLPKISGNFSQNQNDEKNKTIHVLPLNKTFTAHNIGSSQNSDSNRDLVKKTEVFKIWNDANKFKPSTRQSRTPFLQAAHPQSTIQTDCAKAQERLENVKREFSKMIDITEDLLKKSYNNDKFNTVSSAVKKEINKKSLTDVVENCKQEIKKLNSKILESTNDQKHVNAKTYEASGDCLPSASSTINIKIYNDCSKEEVDSVLSYDKSIYSDYSVIERKRQSKTKTNYSPSLSCSPVKPNVLDNFGTSLSKLKPETYYSTTSCPVCNGRTPTLEKTFYSITSSPQDTTTYIDNKKSILKKDSKVTIKKQDVLLESTNINNFKEHVTKTINSLIDGLSKNFQFQPFSGDKLVLDPDNEAKLSGDSSGLSNNFQIQPTSRGEIAAEETTKCEQVVKREDAEKLSNKSNSSNDFRPQASYEELAKKSTNNKENLPTIKTPNQSEDIVSHNCSSSKSDDKIHARSPYQHRFDVSREQIKNADILVKLTKQEKRNKEKFKINISKSNKTNLNIFDEQLKKRNIVLVKEQEKNINAESYVIPKVDSKIEIDEYKKLFELHKQDPKSTSIVTRNLSTHNTNTINNNDVLRKQDIYDKLDSASATDSDVSFAIGGRKSQVIQITDLTTSLDDLERLDKICRIIEISDELSDKLFSALDSGGDIGKRTQKKWSFKDLCEKIRLDDFCNNVFKNNF